MRRLVFIALVLGGCAFNPDLSRFPLCGEGCPAGSSCLTEEQRCVPACGENCVAEDGGADAAVDAGFDAGVDAGTDAGTDAGMDAGGDAGPPLVLDGGTLPPAIETRAYAFTFMPTGGTPAYAFSIDGGVPGLSLIVDGTLSGTPTTPGQYPFSISVQDGASARLTSRFDLEVRPLLRVASAVLVEGRQSQVYAEQLSATGGTPPYTWVVDGGSPPTGLTVTSGGLLQGSPTMSSTVTFGVSVSDSAVPPQNASRTISVETKLLVVTLAIATRAAADGRVGTAYNQPLKSYGGSAPFTWSIVTGSASLPPGVMLTNAGADWQLVGTPTMSGTFPFTLKVADSLLASQQQAMSIIVY